jgi:ADP-heptose:LPS heptosyltransferase
LARRALVVRSGALGDVLLLRRTVARLRAAGCDVHLLAPSGAGPALVGGGGSEVSGWTPSDGASAAPLWAPGGRCPLEIGRLVGGPDPLALAFTGSAEVATHLARTGARVLVRDPQPPTGRHAAEWLSGVLDGAGLPEIAGPEPVLALSSSERAAARPWLDRLPPRFVAVHGGSGSPRKNWPAVRFAQAARSLASGEPFLWVEGPAEAPTEPRALDISTWVGVRGLPLRTLAAVLARASVYLGNDSGVSHLAAAAGAPTVAVFGPTDPVQWSPRGPRTAVVRAGSGSLSDVSVDAVVEAAGRIRS